MKMELMEEYLKPPTPINFDSEDNSVEESQRLLPTDITNLLHGGIAAAKSGDKELARTLFLKVTNLEPNSEAAWLWLASISEQVNERFDFLQKVLSINPSNERALSWLKSLKEHIAKGYVQKGADAAKEGDKATSVQYLLQAIDYDADNEIAWMWLASLATSLEDKLAYLHRILNINPENEQVREMFLTTSRQLARTLAQKGIDAFHLGDIVLAHEKLQDVMDYETDIEEIWLLKAYLTDTLEEKEAFFKRVVELNPGNLTAFTTLKAIQEQIDEKNSWRCPVCNTKEKTPFDICRVCNSIVSLDDIDFVLANDNVNDALIRDGIHNLKRSFKDDITADDYYKLGIAYLNLKDLKESAAFFQASLRLNPENGFLASKVEYMTELCKAKESELLAQVPVVTEESLVAEDSTDPISNFAESNSSSQHEAETDVDFGSATARMSNNEIEAQLEETTNKVHIWQPTSTEEFFETNVASLSSQEEIVEEKLDEKEDSFSSMPTQEFGEKEETLGWPVPETQEVPQVSLADDEIQKIDTAPLSLPESLKEQLEQSFGESPSTVEENDTQQFFSFNEEKTDAVETATSTRFEDVEVLPSFAEQEFFAVEETAVLSLSTEEEVAAPSVEEELVAHCDSEKFVLEECVEVSSEQNFEAASETEHESVLFSPVEESVESLAVEEGATEVVKIVDDSSLTQVTEVETVAPDTNGVEMMEVEISSDVATIVETVAQEKPQDEVPVFETPSSETFSFSFPAIQTRTFDIPSATQSAAKNDGNGVPQLTRVASNMVVTQSTKKSVNKTIMIVDDSPTVRKLVSMKLGKFGHRVITAVDGVDALAKMTEEIPDLILIDVAMPRIDGYQLCKLIKNNVTTQNVPIVMLSGKDGLLDKVRGKMAGASDYMTKPFEPETLLQTVNQHCGIQSN
jgi:twitching motility two-component system response regulator PilG